MFTGIVTDIGEVVAVEPRAEGLARLKIACRYDPDTIDIGASIACSGVCLTVVARGGDGSRAWFDVDAAAETLRVTTVGGWQQRHPRQSRARAQGRRRARRAYRCRPCRRPRHGACARGSDRHGAADVSCAGRARPFRRRQGLGCARRRVADRQRGSGRHVLGADHSAHARDRRRWARTRSATRSISRSI